jgi:hypothetical protein
MELEWLIGLLLLGFVLIGLLIMIALSGKPPIVKELPSWEVAQWLRRKHAGAGPRSPSAGKTPSSEPSGAPVKNHADRDPTP